MPDLVTDYVLRRRDDRYLVVEIERPSTKLFTNAGEFSAAFTHAYGQILGFQAWVTDNLAYAQSKMPGISDPKGILVIGMRSRLAPDEQRKLRFWNAMHEHYALTLCFDDLSAQAQTLSDNLRPARALITTQK